MKPEPGIQTWELWSVATMLVATHGDDAEAHAASKLADAKSRQHEGDEIVWQGIITQLRRIRAGCSRTK
jgi:hypothetical protein